MTKYCSTCKNKSNFQNGTPACALHKIEIDPKKDYCSWHTDFSSRCDKCGRSIPKGETSIVFGPDNLNWCMDCYAKIGMCETCSRGNECAFSADRTSPDMVMRTVTNGGFRMQAQVPNPDKQQIHCVEGDCPCWNKLTNSCNKINAGTCCSWIGKDKL